MDFRPLLRASLGRLCGTFDDWTCSPLDEVHLGVGLSGWIGAGGKHVVEFLNRAQDDRPLDIAASATNRHDGPLV